jgi:hypothetical protein
MENYINKNGECYNSFIYQWFDRKLNKFYIGSHYGHINDGYLFGGIDIKKEYKKRPNDFEREIISYHLVSEYYEIREIEKSYLIKYDVENNDMFYNRTNESYGGYHKNSVDKRLNDIDENGLNSFQRSAIKMVKTRKEKNSYQTAKIKEHITKMNKMDDIKNKISKTLLGSRWINKDGFTKYVKDEDYKDYLKNGWVDGMNHTISYEECRKIAMENNIKSANDWYRYSTENNLPFNPERKYKEWIDWYTFLTKEKIKHCSYEECRIIAVENNIKSAKEWKKLSKSRKEIPFNPDRKYKEWIDWYTFLGQKNK